VRYEARARSEASPRLDGDTRLRRQQLNDDRRRQFGDTGRSLALLCECGDEECYRTVMLSVAEFDAARPEPIVHQAHSDGYWYLATPNPSSSGTLTANDTSDSVSSSSTPPPT
jgi:hypothetical protein